MTLDTVSDGYVTVTKPGDSEPTYTLRPPALQSVAIKERMQDAKDEATITFYNDGGEWAGKITSGDRLDFYVQYTDPGATGDTYGTATFGEATSGGGSGESVHRWTGIAKPPTYHGPPGRRQIQLEATDFVTTLLSWRRVAHNYSNQEAGAVVRDILADECPAIDDSRVQDIGESVSVTFNDTTALDAVTQVARSVDATMFARKDALVFTAVSDIARQWAAEAADFETWQVDPEDDHLFNVLKVVGGTDVKQGDAQTVQDGYTTVTEGTRTTHQLQLPISKIKRADVWTRSTGTGEKVVVRVQEDRAGAPSDPSESTLDLASASVAPDDDEWTDAGYTEFAFGKTDLPAENPWLIIETDGPDGQEIGIDTSTGDPTHKSYFYYPIITQDQDSASITEYRRREARDTKENLSPFPMVRDWLSRRLDHNATPRRSVQADARSWRAHHLRPGEIVELPFEKDTAVGDYLVTERKHVFGESESGRNILTTTLEMQEVATF